MNETRTRLPFFSTELPIAVNAEVKSATLEELCFVLGIRYTPDRLAPTTVTELAEACMKIDTNKTVAALPQPERLSIMKAAAEFIGTLFMIAIGDE